MEDIAKSCYLIMETQLTTCVCMCVIILIFSVYILSITLMFLTSLLEKSFFILCLHGKTNKGFLVFEAKEW